MRYADWCETVLRAVIAPPDDAHMFGMPQLEVALGLKSAATWGDVATRDVDMAIIAACGDLEQIGLIETKHWSSVAPTLDARPYRRESLRKMWPRLRAGDLDPDEEEFLSAIVALSERPHEDWAEAQWVMTAQVFEHLHWDWDRGRSSNLVKVLDNHLFIARQIAVGDSHSVRVRLAGVVRSMDDVGNVLAEARDHFASSRLRAAGCIAGVELERALKALCSSKQAAVTSTLPGISDYNNALWAKKVYSKPTFRTIQVLSDLRNLCAHVLDQEPSEADVRKLVDGVDEILRTLPQ